MKWRAELVFLRFNFFLLLSSLMKCARNRRTIGVGPPWATMSNRVVAIVKKRKKKFHSFWCFLTRRRCFYRFVALRLPHALPFGQALPPSDHQTTIRRKAICRIDVGRNLRAAPIRSTLRFKLSLSLRGRNRPNEEAQPDGLVTLVTTILPRSVYRNWAS